jgi:two-component system, oxyanion-binding sensor
MTTPLHIGFIPLVDAAALIIAVDKGFAAAEGLDVTLVREVSWSNVRDKLNIGLFDAAHLLAPVAIASSLGLGHVKVPIVAPFNLGLNGNAITVSPALHAAIMAEIEGDAVDPMATALALARVVAIRRKSGAEPLTFGMTFPFSTHNYQLRFWMAAGGVDPVSWCARQKRFSRSGKAGRKRMRTCWLPWSGRLPTLPNTSRTPETAPRPRMSWRDPTGSASAPR